MLSDPPNHPSRTKIRVPAPCRVPLYDNPGNAFAFWVTDGVTDLDLGALGS